MALHLASVLAFITSSIIINVKADEKLQTTSSNVLFVSDKGTWVTDKHLNKEQQADWEFAVNGRAATFDDETFENRKRGKKRNWFAVPVEPINL